MTNVRSGERFVWRATRESTRGQYCEFTLFLTATAKVPGPHRHPKQEETFTVITGALHLTAAGRSRDLAAGETGTVPAGTPHTWGNTGGERAEVIVRLTPALGIEDYFAAYCALAAAGKAGPTGLPRNPLQLAVLLDTHRNEFTFATDRQQRLLNPLVSRLAALGRRRGYHGGQPPRAAS